MNVKPRTHLLLDAAIFAAFVVTLGSGLLLWAVFSSGGVHAGHSLAETVTVLGLDRHTTNDLHVWSGLIMGALALLHLVFHWKWITCQVGRLSGSGRRQAHGRARTCPDEYH